MASRALAMREGSAPVRDRLLMTIFLAAVLHGIVILGITFGGGKKGNGAAPGLEVLLVSNEVPTAPRNDSATYLAQRTQLGSGNTLRAVAPRNRASMRWLPGHPGVPHGTRLTAAGSGLPGGEHVVTTTAQQSYVLYVRDLEPSTTAGAGAKPLAIPDPPSQTGPQNDLGPVELRGPHRDDLWVTPDTRKATLAPYLDHWRRRVERIGTLNYPASARQAPSRSNPVVEVTIGSRGKLVAARIARSSGDRALDHAALEILKLASPFDPFPPALARKYHLLRFTYEWEFVGGRASGGTLRAAP
ncbi:MAG: energy transducer TonB family protein [Steroidobacteraceae bacterium]